MKRKLILATAFVLLIAMMTACSGSEAIQGTWKAQDAAGTNNTITFTDKELTVDGQTYSYKQNAIGTTNGIEYYGIIQDGKSYTIIFPEDDKTIAVMIKPDSSDDNLKGTMIYAMNKSTKPSYKDYAAKYMQ